MGEISFGKMEQAKLEYKDVIEEYEGNAKKPKKAAAPKRKREKEDAAPGKKLKRDWAGDAKKRAAESSGDESSSAMADAGEKRGGTKSKRARASQAGEEDASQSAER